MSIRSLLELGNPALRQCAQAVTDVPSAETEAIITDLRDTLREFRRQHGWGRALAAPAIGAPKRIVLIAFEDQELVLINPRFERWSRELAAAYESCMTFSSIWSVVHRPKQVVVVAQDAEGKEQRYEVDGDLARIMQHEIDHLDGLTWLDRDPDLSTICTTNEYRRQFKPPKQPG
jgi:peptide deformylase